MDEDQNSVEEEVTPLDQESTIEDEAQDKSEEDKSPEPEQESAQDRNWRELRRREKELLNKTKMQEEILERLLKQQATPNVAPQEPEESHDPEDFPTWGQAEKAIAKQAEQIAERKYQEMEAKREQSRFLERLKGKHSDFEDIVNSETIELLEAKEPELAQTIADLRDPYKMGLQTYKFIKALNLVPDKAEKRRAKEVDDKIEKANKTVPSPHSFNKRPMAKAFDIASMSKDEKKKLWAETMQYASQAL